MFAGNLFWHMMQGTAMGRIKHGRKETQSRCQAKCLPKSPVEQMSASSTQGARGGNAWAPAPSHTGKGRSLRCGVPHSQVHLHSWVGLHLFLRMKRKARTKSESRRHTVPSAKAAPSRLPQQRLEQKEGERNLGMPSTLGLWRLWFKGDGFMCVSLNKEMWSKASIR